MLKQKVEEISFEDFLSEKHAEQYIGTKDCMIDDYEKWLSDLGIDEWIKLGEQFKKEIISFLLRPFREIVSEKKDIDCECDVAEDCECGAEHKDINEKA